jgi:hypothetical protein
MHKSTHHHHKRSGETYLSSDLQDFSRKSIDSTNANKPGNYGHYNSDEVYFKHDFRPKFFIVVLPIKAVCASVVQYYYAS